MSKTARLQLVGGVEVLKGDGHTLGHGLLTLTHPHTWVVVLLVWLVRAIWVADLAHDVVLLVEDVVADTRQVGPLQIGVEVDLDDTVGDGVLVFLEGGAGTAVEDEVDWLLLVGAGLVLDVATFARQL